MSAANAYAQADEGRRIFRDKCDTCHTIGGGDNIGPDLLGVVERRDPAWLSRWIRDPERVLAEQDPLALRLFNEFDRVAMNNQNIDEAAVASLIAYIELESASAGLDAPVLRLPDPAAPVDRELGEVQSLALAVFTLIAVIIIAVFTFVGRSTAKPQAVDMKAAYKLRRVLFISASAAVVALLAMTLPNNPYNVTAESADEIVYTTARQFSFTYTREPVASAEDLDRVAKARVLEVPVGALVEFRVTSLDANHGFAVYDQQGAVMAQTQAMPGYINRLRLRFSEPGTYPILCLEYCGMAHHVMRSAILVK